MQYVRVAKFRLPIVRASSRDASATRAAILAQWDMLPFLTGLGRIQVTIHVQPSVNLENLERPLESISAAIHAVCTTFTGATVSLVLGSAVPYSEFLSILPSALAPAICASITHLELAGFSGPLITPLNTQAYHAICRVAPTLRTLKLVNVYWLLAHLDPALLPNIERLCVRYENLEYQVAAQQRTILANLLTVVNSCGHKLMALDVLLNSHRLQWEGQPPMLDNRDLRRLKLSGDAFHLLHHTIARTRYVQADITMNRPSDWTHLEGLLGETSSASERLERLHLQFEQQASTVWPVAPSYASFNNMARLRNIELSVSMHSGFSYAPVHTFLRVMPDVAPGLRSLDYHLPHAPFDPVTVYSNFSPIILPICTELSFNTCELDDDDDDDDSEDDDDDDVSGSGIQALVAIMRYFQPPCVRKMVIDLSSPLTEYLPAISQAIRRGAYPSLQG